jgi:predicted MFS family arabinose efflux permease
MSMSMSIAHRRRAVLVVAAAAAVMPLTSGVIARMFGVRYMGTLFGFAFLSHQIGSFFGAWLGGVVYDRVGSYTVAWTIAGILGLLAALMRLPLDDVPEEIYQPV